jgi:hypothetical protein
MSTRSWKRMLSACAATFALSGGLAGLTAGPPSGASSPSLTVSTTSIAFDKTTLGDFTGPIPFTLTNTSSSADVIPAATGFSIAGTGANDYNGIPEDNCSINGTGDITLAPAGSTGSACTLDNFFSPGALGARPATLTVNDSLVSGVTINFSGTGGIGYYQVASDGSVANFGDAAFYGDLSQNNLNSPIVGIAQTGDNGGYWLVARDGGVFSFGDAQFSGSMGGMALNKPIVGIAPDLSFGLTAYWEVASDGGIFSFGGAPFFGSTGGMALNKPIVGMAATNDGRGYWLVASDGGIFAYGDAQFYGSTGSIHLNQPVVGMAPTPDDGGYWLVAADGGIFAYGDAQFYGSTGSIHLVQPITAMTSMPDGGGYWFTAADGGLFNYGNAPFYGAANSQGLSDVTGMTTDGGPTGQAQLDQPALHQSSAHAMTGWLTSPLGRHMHVGPS